jgi:hypothetical protein
MNFQNKSIYPKYKSKKPKLLLKTNNKRRFNITLEMDDTDVNKLKNTMKNVQFFTSRELKLKLKINLNIIENE